MKLTEADKHRIIELRGQRAARKVASQFSVCIDSVHKLWRKQRPPKGYKPFRVRGEEVGCSRLTEEQVIKIRQILDSGETTQKEMALKYGVTPTTICSLYHGRTWAHVEA